MNSMLLKYLQICFAPEGEGGGDPPPAGNPPAAPPADPPPSDAPVGEIDPPQPEADPPQPPPETVPKPIFQARIAALTKQLKDRERELELARMEATLDPTAPPAGNPPRQPQVLNEAVVLAEQIDYNRRVNDLAAVGQTVKPDFMTKINEMQLMHGQLPQTFVEAVMEAGGTPEATAELLYELAQDTATAGQILALPPIKQVAALVKHAQVKSKPKPQTKIPPPPPPIVPKVGGGGAPQVVTDLNDPKMPIDDWMRQRDEQARRARRY